MRIIATLTNRRNGKTTTVQLRPPMIDAGMWTMNEAARRAAFKRLDADWRDTNAGVTSSHTARAVDSSGWPTFTIWPAPGMKAFIFGDWHAWGGSHGTQVLLSDESVKQLRTFDSADDCINWLYLNGHKDAARALNKHVKEG